jgi:hypothetical protein
MCTPQNLPLQLTLAQAIARKNTSRVWGRLLLIGSHVGLMTLSNSRVYMRMTHIFLLNNGNELMLVFLLCKIDIVRICMQSFMYKEQY